mgnify:CR=1 FL=1
MALLPFPESTSVGSPALNIAIFASFVVITLVIVIRVSAGKKTAEQYYTAAGAFTGRQNGVAIAGDYLSAASFLGIAGAIALQGYDGFLYSIGFLVAWLVALLLVAELMRNTGRFTMADVLSYRLKQRPVRIATAISVLTVSFFYLLAQMAGAGGLVSLLLGIQGEMAQNLVIVLVGGIMITYVLIGGMKGTTWVQIIKACLLLGGATFMALSVLWHFGFSPEAMFAEAVKIKTDLTRDEVAHLAMLARIDLSDAELDRMSGELAVILESVARVGQVAADDIPPTSHPLPLTNVTRPDEVRPSLGAEAVLAGAPAAEQQRFAVPRILDED